MTTQPDTKTSIWRFSSRELTVVAAGAAVAVVAVLLASFGGVPKAQPVAGAVLILGIALPAVDQPQRDRPEDGRLGPQPAGRLRARSC
ncbi:MAG: hypothetical protein M0C28_18065 [Candidatus Moduliflexus flocculans]|nr:hypothetical protein [Candidatus Moduliflexus flocculans]